MCVEVEKSAPLVVFLGDGLILAQAQDKDGSILNLQSSTLSIVCPTGGTAVNKHNKKEQKCGPGHTET